MNENRNLIAAAILSALVLFGWEYFVAGPQLEKERARQALLHHERPGAKPQATPNAPSSLPTSTSSLSRADALKAGGARIAVDTPSLDERVMAALAEAEEPLPFADLRARCRVRAATLHERVGLLAAAGRIVKTADGYRRATP